MKINKELILSIPKTIYFNFKAFSFKTAITLPIIVSYRVKLGKVYKNVINLENYDKEKYKIWIGFGGSKHIIPNKYTKFDYGKKANIKFFGKCKIAEGCSIRCDYGTLEFGKNVSLNRNCCINCEYKMSFGDEVTFGWNVNVRDTDGHTILEDGVKKETQKPVKIGKHVWICSYSDILKGVEIGMDSVVAWRSCVLKPISENNVLIGGFPAKILKNNINWKK